MRHNGSISDEVIIAQYNRRGVRCRETADGTICVPSYNSRGKMSDSELTEICQRVAADYPVREARGRFEPFPEMKAKWQRTQSYIEFRITDYLQDAPYEVVEDLVRSIFARIYEGDESYAPKLYQHVTDPSFHQRHQETYIKRAKLSGSSIGNYHDLNDCVNRLRDSGLLPDDIQGVLTWGESGRHAGGCSVLQRVVSVSRDLDRQGVPEYVLDYVVYHEFCHLILGFDPTGQRHNREFEPLVGRFKMRFEAEHWLNEHGMYL